MDEEAKETEYPPVCDKNGNILLRQECQSIYSCSNWKADKCMRSLGLFELELKFNKHTDKFPMYAPDVGLTYFKLCDLCYDREKQRIKERVDKEKYEADHPNEILAKKVGWAVAALAVVAGAAATGVAYKDEIAAAVEASNKRAAADRAATRSTYTPRRRGYYPNTSTHYYNDVNESNRRSAEYARQSLERDRADRDRFYAEQRARDQARWDQEMARNNAISRANAGYK